MANSGELNPLQWNYKSVTTYLGVGFGAIMGGVVGAGIATPGSVVFAGGISTPYLSAGLAVGAVGKGSNWKFDFHWTTVAGGGGSVTNSTYDADAADKAIKKAQWDYSAFQHATAISVGLAVDDITGVGVADNVLIPVAYGVAAFGVMTEHLYKKQEKQIERLALKDRPGNGFTYQLEAITDGYYKNVRTNKMVYLKEGEVWKYGETTQGEKRYSKSSYEKTQFKMQPIFYGTKTEILIQEKIMLFWYFAEHHQLPPGNKRFH